MSLAHQTAALGYVYRTNQTADLRYHIISYHSISISYTTTASGYYFLANDVMESGGCAQRLTLPEILGSLHLRCIILLLKVMRYVRSFGSYAIFFSITKTKTRATKVVTPRPTNPTKTTFVCVECQCFYQSSNLHAKIWTKFQPNHFLLNTIMKSLWRYLS